MARPTTKTDLMVASENNYEELKKFIASMTDQELSTPFDFQGMRRRRRHTGRGTRICGIFWSICTSGISWRWTGCRQIRGGRQSLFCRSHILGRLMGRWMCSSGKSIRTPRLRRQRRCWSSRTRRSCSWQSAFRMKSCLQRVSLTGWETAHLVLTLWAIHQAIMRGR